MIDLLATLPSVLMAAGGIGGIVYMMTRRQAAWMRRLPVVPIASVAVGERVRIVGRVEAVRAPVAAPISGQPASYYQVMLRRSGLGNAIEYECEGGFDFDVVDGSGRARIRTASRICLLTAQRSGGRGAGSDVPAAFRKLLLEEHASDEWQTMSRLSWHEWRVAPNDRVTVVSVARREADDEGAAYRDAPPLLVLGGEGEDEPVVYISDDVALVDDDAKPR